MYDTLESTAKRDVDVVAGVTSIPPTECYSTLQNQKLVALAEARAKIAEKRSQKNHKNYRVFSKRAFFDKQLPEAYKVSEAITNEDGRFHTIYAVNLPAFDNCGVISRWADLEADAICFEPKTLGVGN